MSEIKSSLYTRLGYLAPRPVAEDWAFTASVARRLAPAVSLLSEADVPAASEALCSLARASLAPGCIAVLPTADMLLWSRRRDEAASLALGEPVDPSFPCGASCGDALVLWALDHEEISEGSNHHTRVLRILAFISSPNAADDAAVLRAAVDEAARAGAPSGRAISWNSGTLCRMGGNGESWSPPEAALEAAGVRCALEPRRCASVPMMRSQVGATIDPQLWRWVPRSVWV